MSFRERTEAVLEQGRKDRAEYSPAPGSAPLRMYQAWAKRRPRSVPERENFCHYWRVVLFWGPLAVVGDAVINRLANMTETTVGKVALVTVFVLGILGVITLLGGTGGLEVLAAVLAVAFGIGYALTGLIVGATYGNDPEDFLEEYPSRWPFWATLPVSILSFAVFRFANWVALSPKRKKIAEYVGYGVLGLIGLALLGLLVWAAIHEIMAFLAGLALFVGVIVLIIGLMFLGSFIKERRERAKEKRTEWVDKEVWPGYTHKVAVVKPSKIGSFFIAVGDFLNLAFQAVRVKKWKICPIVEIPNGR